MISFLTSSFVKYQRPAEYVPEAVNPAHGFVENLKKYWKSDTRFLMFASDPSDFEMNDHVVTEMYESFTKAGLAIKEIKCFDYRAIDEFCKRENTDRQSGSKMLIKKLVDSSDVVFLAGGHAPTENSFIKMCDLKSALGLFPNQKEYSGIFIGLSAGSVNSAKNAYIIPELPGEGKNKDYVKYAEGLGITRLKIIPHSEYEKTVVLDGLKLVDDIVCKDSFGDSFMMIEDGSYFVIKNGITEFFGKGEIIEDGIIRPLSEGVILADSGKLYNIDEKMQRYINRMSDSVLSDSYEYICLLDVASGRVRHYYMSHFMLLNGFIPINLDTIGEIHEKYSKDLVVDEEKEPYLQQIQMDIVLNEIEHDGEYVRTVHINTDEGIKAEKLVIRPLGGSIESLLCVLTNITSVVDHDWMTDVYSRSGFISRAESFLEGKMESGEYCLVYTNVQGLKVINEIFGTHGGDMAIFQVRDSIIRALEPIILARLESDHFACITKFENIKEDTLEKLCYQTYEADSKRYQFVVSCGIYRILKPRNVVHMIDRAKLTENATSSAHPYIVYSVDMRDNYIEQRLLLSEIDSALQGNEFKAYFQPVVDINTGEIVSAEALVRWQHHDKGMISPGVFVPALEQAGLISKIDDFMVNRVIEFNKERRLKGQRFVPCAVNLSRVDLYDLELTDNISRSLASERYISEMLKLEVTESAYVELHANALSFLNNLHEMGMSILLDDFGSGMSSLSTLETFDFDIVKIDMGFIKKIGKNKKVDAIVKAIIELSHAIGARVVAEGVEYKEQLDILKTAGCDMIQGYYFYKPMPEEEFAKLLGV